MHGGLRWPYVFHRGARSGPAGPRTVRPGARAGRSPSARGDSHPGRRARALAAAAARRCNAPRTAAAYLTSNSPSVAHFVRGGGRRCSHAAPRGSFGDPRAPRTGMTSSWPVYGHTRNALGIPIRSSPACTGLQAMQTTARQLTQSAHQPAGIEKNSDEELGVNDRVGGRAEADF